MSASIAVVFAALFTAAGTFLIARRTTSGRIGTSDAASLWAESQAMRRELREEVIALRADNAALRQEVARLRDEVAGLRREVEAKDDE